MIALLVPLTTVQGQMTGADTLLTPKQWVEFHDNIAVAIVSENPGIVEGGLRQIVRYGEFLDLERTSVFDVMRIYRDHSDENMRMLAVRALGSANDRWAIEFLDMIVEWEANPAVKKAIKGVVSEYWKSHGGNPYRG
jgi:hypothetical protein